MSAFQTSPATSPMISIVTPVYSCAGCLEELYSRIVESLNPITDDFEVIMVNDASPDDAWRRIRELGTMDHRAKGINLSRNFGQHHAITAGLDFAGGKWVVVMDCDLQDQPEEIPKLYEKALAGYDVVFGMRAARKDGFLKRLGSTCFYKTLGFFTDRQFDSSIANFSILSRKVVTAFREMREQNRFFSLAVFWLGFRTTEISIEHAKRPEGPSSYSVRKLIYLAYDVIVSQSNKPLRLSIGLGFLIALGAVLYAIYLAIRYVVHGVPVEGWTSVMVSVYFLSGMMFANMGILGLYIGKIFNEAKGRPLYVVQDFVNLGGSALERTAGAADAPDRVA